MEIKNGLESEKCMKLLMLCGEEILWLTGGWIAVARVIRNFSDLLSYALDKKPRWLTCNQKKRNSLEDNNIYSYKTKYTITTDLMFTHVLLFKSKKLYIF